MLVLLSYVTALSQYPLTQTHSHSLSLYFGTSPSFTIQSTAQLSSALPAAHTCFNILDLPVAYESKAQLAERVHIALQHYSGFGLV